MDLHGLGKLAIVETWLTSLIGRRPAGELTLIEALIPRQSVALARVAVALCETQLRTLPPTPGADEERARILTNLGVLYSALGRREEALRAAERAVEIREQLGAQNPDVTRSMTSRSGRTAGHQLSRAPPHLRIATDPERRELSLREGADGAQLDPGDRRHLRPFSSRWKYRVG